MRAPAGGEAGGGAGEGGGFGIRVCNGLKLALKDSETYLVKRTYFTKRDVVHLQRSEARVMVGRLVERDLELTAHEVVDRVERRRGR